MSEQNVDLDLVASFASGLNQEIQQSNNLIDPRDRTSDSAIPMVRLEGQAPQQETADGSVAPMSPNFRNDGFGDIDENMMSQVAHQQQQMAQPPQLRTQAPLQPQRVAEGVVNPSLETAIYRMLLTISKNQQKMIDLLVEDRKLKSDEKGNSSK